MPTLYTQLRKAIAGSGKSRYQISQETGIGQPQLCDFMKGLKGLSVESLETLADCLGLKITLQPRPRNARGRAGVKSRRKEF